MAKLRATTALRKRIVGVALDKAFIEVMRRAKSSSRGPDDVTVAQFRANWCQEKTRIREQIRDHSYKFPSPIGVALAKDKSRRVGPTNVRPITIFAVRDRVVQRAILNTIWTRIRDRVVTKCSFGGVRQYKVRNGTRVKHSFSRTRNTRMAAEEIVRLREDGNEWLFETDICDFFPSVPKESLMQELNANLQDNSIADLLWDSIQTGVSNIDDLAGLGVSERWDPLVGVPQGGVLSPVLANFYLYPLDQAMIKERFRMVRYVDDLVVLARDEREANVAHELCCNVLGDLNLKCHPLDESVDGRSSKTRIVPPRRSFDFLGLTFYWDSIEPRRKKREGLTRRLRGITDARENKHATLVSVISDINAVVNGWLTSFSMCNFSEQQIDDIDHHARTLVSGWMHEVGLSSSRNFLNHDRARLIGLRPATAVALKPIMKRLIARSAVVGGRKEAERVSR